MMNRTIPISTMNFKSTKGKTGLLGGGGYLLGKSGGGKGKFDMEFMHEKEEDVASNDNPLKASYASFPKTSGEGSGGYNQGD